MYSTRKAKPREYQNFLRVYKRDEVNRGIPSLMYTSENESAKTATSKKVVTMTRLEYKQAKTSVGK